MVLTLVSISVLLPLVLTFLYSFFPVSEMNAYLKTRSNYDEARDGYPVVALIVSLRQYYSLLIEKPVYLQLFTNSVLYTGAILLGQMLVIPALAYALARFKFWGRDMLFFLS